MPELAGTEIMKNVIRLLRENARRLLELPSEHQLVVLGMTYERCNVWFGLSPDHRQVVLTMTPANRHFILDLPSDQHRQALTDLPNDHRQIVILMNSQHRNVWFGLSPDHQHVVLTMPPARRSAVLSLLSDQHRQYCCSLSGVCQLAYLGDVDAVQQLLIKSPSTVNEIQLGTSPLIVCVGSPLFNIDILSMLVDAGADCNFIDAQRGTALVVAAKNSNWVAVSVLILNGHANVMISASNGDSPLHIALRNEAPVGILVTLLEAGADRRVLNQQGLSPLDQVSENAIKAFKSASSMVVAPNVRVGGSEVSSAEWTRQRVELETRLAQSQQLVQQQQQLLTAERAISQDLRNVVDDLRRQLEDVQQQQQQLLTAERGTNQELRGVVDDLRLQLNTAQHQIQLARRNTNNNNNNNNVNDESIVADIPYGELVIGDRLGHGACKEVYTALWRQASVAVCSFKCHSTLENLKIFRREVDHLRLPSHENVVKMVGVCSTPPNLAIVTEYVDGGDLCALLYDDINSVRLSLLSRLHLLRGIAQGVRHLHQHNICHRDLKSANVLLTPAPGRIPKITDFGLAKTYATSMMVTGGQQGTAHWMAPEVVDAVQGEEYSGTKADVFSWAMVAYEVSSNCHPFEGMNPQVVMRQVSLGRRPDLASVRIDDVPLPSSVVDMIGLCWSQDPSTRPEMTRVCAILDTLIQQASNEEIHREDRECVVCMDSPRACVFGCGHAVECLSCGQQVLQRALPCPICRRIITSVQPLADIYATFLPQHVRQDEASYER